MFSGARARVGAGAKAGAEAGAKAGDEAGAGTEVGAGSSKQIPGAGASSKQDNSETESREIFLSCCKYGDNR